MDTVDALPPYALRSPQRIYSLRPTWTRPRPAASSSPWNEYCPAAARSAPKSACGSGSRTGGPASPGPIALSEAGKAATLIT